MAAKDKRDLQRLQHALKQGQEELRRIGTKIEHFVAVVGTHISREHGDASRRKRK